MKKRLLLRLLSFVVIISAIPISSVSAKTMDTNINQKNEIVSADDLLLYPALRTISSQDGIYSLVNGKIVSDEDSLTAIDKIIQDTSDLSGISLSKDSGDTVINIKQDDSLDEQGYSLEINEDGVSILYKDKEGAYYAAGTLYQILWQTKDQLPYLSIENDHPDFKYRAFDMDISRNRLPSVETAKRVIDLMANLKYNQMFFYLEGFSYAYGSYPQVWSGGDPMTPAQVKELSDYASQRGIELIPAQNSFGHSSQWIANNEFQELGDANGSTTFNVFDPGTQELLTNIYDDLFDGGFQSDYLQVGGDETTLDLENGRAAASWKQLNPGQTPTQSDLYMDSMEIIYDIATDKNKTMLYWGDMIIHYDLYAQAKEKMPDAIAMDWGYLHDYDFESSTSKLNAADIPYYVCAGDSSWSTIVGNTYVMNKNAETAAIAGKKNNALGYAMTNWGDAGHYQNIVATYPAIAYAGGLSWCTETNMKEENSYDEFLNMFLYQDSTNTLSQAYSELADYSNNYLPYGWNGNWIANCMIEPWSNNSNYLWDFMDFQENGKDNVITEENRDKSIAQCDQVSQAAQTFLDQLEKADIKSDDAQLLYLEFKNTAEMTIVAAEYTKMRLRLFTGGDIQTPLSTREEEKETAIANAKKFQSMIEDFKEIWKARDVYGELPSTLGWISKPAMMYQAIGGVSNIYQPQPDGNLFLKTPETIGTDLSVDDFVVNGWTWTNYGTGMPAISNTYMGGESVGQVKNAITQKVFSISDNESGVDGMTFAYNSKAAIDGGFYENNPTWGPLLPRCGWPAVIPKDGDYILSAKLKFDSGRSIHSGTVALSGGANRVSDGSLMDVPLNPQWEISQPDANGWYDVKIRFSISDADGISFGILPQNDVKDDTLYINNLFLKEDIPEIIISSDHPNYTVLNLNDNFTVPTATSNGVEPIEVTLQKPDNSQIPVEMGNSITADQVGVYRLNYTAKDANKSLQIVFEVKAESDNILHITDENATGFIPSNQFFALVNPYFSGNNGFNDEGKLITYGNDTLDPTQYASLISNEDGGNGQVILLDTNKLNGDNRVPVVNFSAEIEPGKTYHLSVRMKYWRQDMSSGIDLGPFQTAINYFNSDITDQAGDQWDDYKYIHNYLDDTQKALAMNGEWFTYEQEFTVPDTVTINGEQKVPTALNTFFMTSSNNTAEDQHKMWIDDIKLEEVKPIEHNYTKVDAKAATCIEDGNITYWYCETCDEYFSDDQYTNQITKEDTIIKATGHTTLQSVAKKDPTCNEDGNIAYWYCETCKKYFSDEKATNEITKDDIVIKATGHTEFEIINKKEATCTEEGYTGDKVCKKDGTIIEKGEIIPKATHEFKDGKCVVCGASDPNYKPETPSKPESPDKPDTPKVDGNKAPESGDNSNRGLLVNLLFISIGSTLVITYRKKQKSKKSS